MEVQLHTLLIIAVDEVRVFSARCRPQALASRYASGYLEHEAGVDVWVFALSLY